MTNNEFETICDGIFEANNFLQEENRAAKKLAILPGEPGSPERIATYRKMVESEQPLPSEL